MSWLTVTLEAKDTGGTRFVLEHFALADDERAQEFWDQYGPGAVGVGWDGAVLGLTLYLETGEPNTDAEAWSMSEEGKRFSARSSEAWGEAAVSWGADPDWARGAVARTTAFYTGAPA